MSSGMKYIDNVAFILENMCRMYSRFSRHAIKLIISFNGTGAASSKGVVPTDN